MKFGYVSWINETEEVQKFVQNLSSGKLTTTKCKKCGEIHLPPRLDCPHCNSSEMEWIEMSPEAELVTYTIIHFAPESMTKMAPYIVAIGEFENGKKLLAHLITTPSKLKIGMKMVLKPQELEGDRITYKFVG
ncbi:MAG: Zn-ribbon domain-containing OB-fold protein [Candidatus Methanofastidiosia archaeon]